MNLQERLLRPATRERVVRDCAAIVERQVAAARGAAGLAVRASFTAVTALRPDLVPRAINRLLPDFASAMDSLTADDFSVFLSRHPEKVVDALLGVTDAKIAATNNRLLRASYERLRPLAERQVSAALPLLGERLKEWLRTT